MNIDEKMNIKKYQLFVCRKGQTKNICLLTSNITLNSNYENSVVGNNFPSRRMDISVWRMYNTLIIR